MSPSRPHLEAGRDTRASHAAASVARTWRVQPGHETYALQGPAIFCRVGPVGAVLPGPSWSELCFETRDSSRIIRCLTVRSRTTHRTAREAAP